MRTSAFLFFIITGVASVVSPVFAQPGAETGKGNDAALKPQYSFHQNETGIAVVQSITVADGKLVFRTVSGGCTFKDSFRIDVKKSTWNAAGDPLYTLTVVRTKPDECKSLIAEGVDITFDLEKDLGLVGWYTVVVTNPVNPWKK